MNNVPQPCPKCSFGDHQPGGNGALRLTEGGCDFPVGVAVEVAEDDHRGLLRGQPTDFGQHLAAGRPLLRVGRDGPAQPEDQLANFAESPLADEGQSGVDRNPVDPRLRRRVSLPPWPCAIGLEEGVLGAIFGCRGVTQDRRQCAKDALVARLIKAVEVFFGSGLILHRGRRV